VSIGVLPFAHHVKHDFRGVLSIALCRFSGEFPVTVPCEKSNHPSTKIETAARAWQMEKLYDCFEELSINCTQSDLIEHEVAVSICMCGWVDPYGGSSLNFFQAFGTGASTPRARFAPPDPTTSSSPAQRTCAPFLGSEKSHTPSPRPHK